ncbi:MAG: hypothetical protein N2F24_16365, partial [Deltaproteobacteria bacterium]
MTGMLKQRLTEGKWVQAEGAVYDEFDPGLHVIEPFTPPPHARYIVGIDFGYTNPLVCSLWYLDEDERMYLTRQIYKSRRTITDHLPAIRDMTRGLNIEAWVTDHAAQDRATLENALGI